MSSTNFEACLTQVLRHEGGFVNHPEDPGGATNMGITIGTLSLHLGRRATVSEVRNLSRATVAEIYRKRYWKPVQGSHLPVGIDLVVFDAAVNSGPARGVRWLQAALGVARDGKIGPVTASAARNQSVPKVIERACVARMSFLRGLRHWGTFGRGWSRRVAGVEVEALRMHQVSAGYTASKIAQKTDEAKRAALAKADTAKKAGAAQAAGGVAVPAGAAQFDNVPADVIPWLIVAGVVVAVLVILRAQLRNRHQLARAAAFREIEVET